jgi:hypothetical protein
VGLKGNTTKYAPKPSAILANKIAKIFLVKTLGVSLIPRKEINNITIRTYGIRTLNPWSCGVRMPIKIPKKRKNDFIIRKQL